MTGPFTVMDRLGPVTYRVQKLPRGRAIVTHVDKLKRYYPPTCDDLDLTTAKISNDTNSEQNSGLTTTVLTPHVVTTNPVINSGRPERKRRPSAEPTGSAVVNSGRPTRERRPPAKYADQNFVRMIVVLDKMLICSICQAALVSKHAMRRHRRRFHPDGTTMAVDESHSPPSDRDADVVPAAADVRSIVSTGQPALHDSTTCSIPVVEVTSTTMNPSTPDEQAARVRQEHSVVAGDPYWAGWRVEGCGARRVLLPDWGADEGVSGGEQTMEERSVSMSRLRRAVHEAHSCEIRRQIGASILRLRQMEQTDPGWRQRSSMRMAEGFRDAKFEPLLKLNTYWAILETARQYTTLTASPMQPIVEGEDDELEEPERVATADEEATKFRVPFPHEHEAWEYCATCNPQPDQSSPVKVSKAVGIVRRRPKVVSGEEKKLEDIRVVVMDEGPQVTAVEKMSMVEGSQVVAVEVHQESVSSRAVSSAPTDEEQLLGAVGGVSMAADEDWDEIVEVEVDSPLPELNTDQDWIREIYRSYGTQEISPIATISGPSASTDDGPWGGDSPDQVLTAEYVQKWHPYFPAAGGRYRKRERKRRNQGRSTR